MDNNDLRWYGVLPMWRFVLVAAIILTSAPVFGSSLAPQKPKDDGCLPFNGVIRCPAHAAAGAPTPTRLYCTPLDAVNLRVKGTMVHSDRLREFWTGFTVDLANSTVTLDRYKKFPFPQIAIRASRTSLDTVLILPPSSGGSPGPEDATEETIRIWQLEGADKPVFIVTQPTRIITGTCEVLPARDPPITPVPAGCFAFNGNVYCQDPPVRQADPPPVRPQVDTTPPSGDACFTINGNTYCQ